MTDDELKALVASLAVAQKATDEQIKLQMQLNAVAQKATDEQIKLQMQLNALAQKATDEQIRSNDKMLTEKLDRMGIAQKATDEQIKLQMQLNALAQKATDEQIRSNDKMLTEKLDRMGITLGNIGQNQGDVAEEFFFNSLANDTHLGSVYFDDIEKNGHKRRGKTEEEYDIIMTNGDAIGIVEVKYKAHSNDLDKLDRKMKHFKKLFPIYQNYKQYGAIASFHINDEAKKEALKRGYFVLQRSGDLVHTESGEHLMVL